MYPFAEQIHTHARSYRGYIICAEGPYNRLERVNDLLLRHYDLGMFAADIFGGFTGILQVNGVTAHAYRKRSYRFVGFSRRNGANEGGIESAGEQKANLCV